MTLDGRTNHGATHTAHDRAGRHGERAHTEGTGPTAVLAPVIDEDELEAADSFDLPGADLSSEEISVQILAAQADEFTCASCFLVRHRSQIAHERGGLLYCVDCEG
ncbi:DUF4193 domain-containing protein [Arthrobacter agilis]|uniref:DUF4193 domain-containing protein n=1 Tax=Arthrobacter agilis TaxID=37921 RepID=UPI0027826FDB|nr:DUF4193 domain-containing protein [Arthrobacter agilis]MDQ0734408.1 hypothetical protein [Arthrobacter agilis]